MQRLSSIFSQFLQLFSRIAFEQVVKKHRIDYSAKGLSSWESVRVIEGDPFYYSDRLHSTCCSHHWRKTSFLRDGLQKKYATAIVFHPIAFYVESDVI
jgi:hypothetical protein